MKKVKRAVLLSILLVSLGGVTYADLSAYSTDIVRDDRGTAGDTTDDLYFYRHLTAFTSLNYAGQIAAIPSLSTVLPGTGPWRMATSADMAGLFADPTGVMTWFYPTGTIGTPPDEINYWKARYDQTGAQGEHMIYELDDSPWTDQYDKLDTYADPTLSAWAVTEVVPVPGAFLLGVIGLSVVGAKLKKHV